MMIKIKVVQQIKASSFSFSVFIACLILGACTTFNSSSYYPTIDYEIADLAIGLDPPPQKLLDSDKTESDVAFKLAEHYFLQKFSDESNPTAIKWLIEAEKLDHPFAANELGTLFLLGDYQIPVDYQAAYYWFKKAKRFGGEYAFYNLGVMIRDGKGVRRNSKKATNYFFKAANLGNVHAKLQYGINLKEGLGIKRNVELGESYIRESINEGLDLELLFQTDVCLEIFETDACSIVMHAIDPLNNDYQSWMERTFQVADMLDNSDSSDYYLKDSLVDIAKTERSKDVINYLFEFNREELQSPEFTFHLHLYSASNGNRNSQQVIATRYRQGYGVKASEIEEEYWQSRADEQL